MTIDANITTSRKCGSLTNMISAMLAAQRKDWDEFAGAMSRLVRTEKVA